MQNSPLNGKIIIWKSFVFFLVVLLGVLSLVAIGRNVYSYINAKEILHQQAVARIEREKQEQAAVLKAELERRKLAQREAQRQLFLRELVGKSQELAAQNKFQEAIELLKNYNGEFAKDTDTTRNKLADEYFQQFKKQQAIKREQILGQIAKLLLKRNFSEACQLAEENSDWVLPPISQLLQKLKDADRLLAQTFKSDLNGLLLVNLQSSGLVSTRLLKISGDNLIIQQGSAEKNIAVSDIAISEREKRIKVLDHELQTLYLGIEYWRLKNYEMTAKYLAVLPGDLGEQLRIQTGTDPKQVAERKAQIELFHLLRTNKLIADELTAKSIAENLSKRQVPSSVDRSLKDSLNQYQKQYKSTEYLKQQKAVIMQLERYLHNKVDYLAYSKLTRKIRIPELPLKLLEHPPEAFWDIPQGKEKYYFAKLSLGPNNSINFVFSLEKTPKMLFTFDDDTDFIGKSFHDLVKGKLIELPVKYKNHENDEYTEPYCISLRADKDKIKYQVAGMRAGEVLIARKTYWIEIVDFQATGQYKGSKNVKFYIYENKEQTIPIAELDSGKPFTRSGFSFYLQAAEESGSHLELSLNKP